MLAVQEPQERQGEGEIGYEKKEPQKTYIPIPTNFMKSFVVS